MESPVVTKPTFEEAYPEINRIVQSRRSAWTYVSVVEWADISQILLLHLFEKWHLFDPTLAPLEHWANRVISNALHNAKRDHGGVRFQRPCVGGGKANGKSCVYNIGGDSCSFTKSGKQCSECPLYHEWKKTREHQFNIKSSVALENHVQEVSNLQEDFHDYEGIKNEVDAQMKEELTPWEYRVYSALYIRHLSPTQVSHDLQSLIKTWKRLPRAGEQSSYQMILSYQRQFKQMMLEILKRQGHL